MQVGRIPTSDGIVCVSMSATRKVVVLNVQFAIRLEFNVGLQFAQMHVMRRNARSASQLHNIIDTKCVYVQASKEKEKKNNARQE